MVGSGDEYSLHIRATQKGEQNCPSERHGLRLSPSEGIAVNRLSTAQGLWS